MLLTDPIDEFWVASVGTYKEKPFKSATRGGADLDKIEAPEDKKDAAEKPEPPPKLASLIAIFKLALGDAVKDVRSSERLTDSAVCLVADEGDIDMHLERLLKQHRQLDTAAKRILELNPRHPLIVRLAASAARPAPPTAVGSRLAAAGSGPHRRGRAAARPAGLRPPLAMLLERACPRRLDASGTAPPARRRGRGAARPPPRHRRDGPEQTGMAAGRERRAKR